MKNSKSTKKALLASVLSLLLCFTMLIGTTFAWFTDTVTSANNIIMSGNLDVDLEYWNGTEWKTVNGASDVLSGDKWEPGYVDVAYLRVRNNGSLALKYKLGVNIISETKGVNVAGTEFKLSDYIYFDVFNGQKPSFADRDAAMAGTTEITRISTAYSKTGTLEANSEYDYLAMVVYMPESVGNVANHNGVNLPKINLGITLNATQLNSELDGFGPDYDESALICDVYANPTNVQDVIAEAEEGTVIGLTDGVYGDIVIQDANGGAKKDITLVANGAVVASVNLNGSTFITLDNIIFDANKSTTVWSYSQKNGTTNSGVCANIVDTTKTNSAYGAQNITITNCTFKPVSAVASHAGAEYVCIATGSSRVSQENRLYVIEDCSFKCDAVNYLRINYVNDNVVVKDNVFGGDGFGTSHNSINAVSSGANWTVSGNVFNAWNPIKTAIGSSRSSIAGIVTWTVVNNEFNGSDNSVVLALKARDGVRADAYKDGNTVVVFAGNTALGGYGTIVDTTRNAEDDENIFNGKKIALNAGVVEATTDAAFDAAIGGGASTILISDGNYIIPDSAQGKTLTIIGNGNSVVATQDDGSYEGCDYSLDGATVVFENIVINTDSRTYTGYARLNATYKNCTINGTYTLYGDSVFENCTFNVNGDVYNIWTWGAPNATFTDCTFNCDGKALLLYGNTNTNLILTNCTFNDNGTISDKAAIEIGTDWAGDTKNVIVNNCTVNGFDVTSKGTSTGTTLWGNKNSISADRLNVVVDGVDVY